ncbi:MAG: ATP-grasp domain-containing protein [Flammeovirgaceae bacterium]
MGKVLLICNSDDEQIAEVIDALKQLGTENYVRFNADRIHLDYELSIYPNESDFSLMERGNENAFRCTDFTAVWYTEPDVAHKKFGGMEEGMYEYLASEYKAAVEALIACFELRGMKLVSSPGVIATVGNKQKQQMIAKKVGFQLPKQLVTTQNEAFTTEAWATYAVLKPIDSHKQFEHQDESDGMFTQFVHEALYAGIESGEVSLEIHYFQERLDQLAEYRVIAFGEYAYAFKLTGDYEVDWRRDLSIITFEYLESFALNHLCTAYLKETGLNFGSFDLMETKEGFFFIECNSPGYFLFCEKSEEIGLAKKFAAYLLET